MLPMLISRPGPAPEKFRTLLDIGWFGLPVRITIFPRLATVKLRHSQPPFTHGQFLRGGDVNAKQMAAKGYNVSWLARVPLRVLKYASMPTIK